MNKLSASYCTYLLLVNSINEKMNGGNTPARKTHMEMKALRLNLKNISYGIENDLRLELDGSDIHIQTEFCSRAP